MSDEATPPWFDELVARIWAKYSMDGEMTEEAQTRAYAELRREIEARGYTHKQ